MVPTDDNFVLEMEKRFERFLHSEDEDERTAAQLFIYGSQQYEIEEEALAFLQETPEPTAKELLDFFDATAPEGLAPGDDGLDLLE